ncbi:hypothetical protein ACIGEZ_12985 [Streptomyces sp. NPDC085481]|uniref:hypothetical protein n=1 Tax=Streptomyces sp. NPDC085481 TaxID=3365727 RepID=UPI0037CEE494
MTTSDPSPGAPSRALRVRAAGGWERFMRRVEAEGVNPVGSDGYEQHPLLHTKVRDTASKGEGELTAVTHELHGDGRVVRIAHIRSENGVEWTSSADNIRPADADQANRTTTGSDGGGSQPSAPQDADALEDHQWD